MSSTPAPLHDVAAANGLPPGWQTAPPLTGADLTGSFWRFGRLDDPPFSPFIVLAPDGRIGNYRHPNEDGWQVTRGRLALVNEAGVASTIFTAAQMQGGQVAALAGPVLVPGYTHWHELRRTEHPAHPLHATPPDADRRARFVTRADRPRAPNLVVLRAGPGSLHPAWPADIEPEQRSWDLCLSCYGEAPDLFPGDGDYLTHQPAQRKFQAIYDLFYPDSPLWQYERIWLPDDDLMLRWSDLNRLFHIARIYALDLAQPSLRPGPDCFITHPVTAQQPGTRLRYSSFIEIMCPVFSRRALRICLGSFRDSVSGFGLDHLWPSLLGWPRARMAVIDAVGIAHTRPLGQNYDIHKASAEERALLAAYRHVRLDLPNIGVVP